MKIENMLQRFSCISFLFTPPWLYGIMRLQNARHAKIPHFLLVDHWTFCSVFCPYLIQIQENIPINLWNIMNLWPIWWNKFSVGITESNSTVKIVIHLKFWGFRYVQVYWQTRTNSFNWAQEFRFWDGRIIAQWKKPFLSVPQNLLPKFLQSSLYWYII